ncbi:hypothetical protein BU16DRAFT_556886 [Lophium mytilinum]|uniref:Glucosidase 2 subunit beta n=1 Tax=Lophium mytilinum TaxID=390894 RepID=A0A6A6R7G7_9PEZI|nr:hypothetical protein BU16DRAFT_556886 [Lophium mytilinum]
MPISQFLTAPFKYHKLQTNPLPPTVAKFYKSPSTFTCISNPSLTLPLTHLNDDYCDCPDGSDEPGTAACAHLSPLSPPSPAQHQNPAARFNETLALPGFYCKNKGHIPLYIPFSNVNDGICDYEVCCDGSDEWAGVGGVKCEDRCAKIGKEWRKQDEERKKSLGAANKRRRELMEVAGRLRREVEDRIKTLGAQIQGQEVKVASLETELAGVERSERGRVVKGPGKGGKVAVLASLAKGRVGELAESLGRVRGEREAARERVRELEQILATFKEERNPNFNDEGVKRAVKAWEDYAARDKGPDSDPALDRDLDEILKSDAENGLNWEDFETTEESDVEVLYKFEEYLPKPVRDWVDQKLRDLRVTLIENGVLAAPHSDAGESKAVQDARQQLESAKKDLENDRKELTSHQEDLQKEYGPDNIFRALKDQCIDKDSGEYTYSFCWLGQTTQKSKKGGGHTNMGNFVRIEKVTVDEDVPPDGKGLGSGERYSLVYENGQHCWNGPNRSTRLILACAEKDEIWKIVEQEKCVYRMEVGTPAVCESAAASSKAPAAKDEL